jgi:hypothetical protein
MTMMPPFTPGTTAKLTGITTTTAVALTKPGQQVLVTSPSGGTQALAFIKFGDSTVTATANTDVPILPGTTQIFTPPSTATHVAGVSAAATDLYFTSGIGE